MKILIDAILALMLIIPALSGAMKGFVRSVMNLVTFAASFICSWIFTPMLSQYLMNKVYTAKVTKTVSDAIGSLAGGIAGIDLGTLFDDMPTAFVSLLDRFGVTADSAQAFYQKEAAAGVSNLQTLFINYLATPIARAISHALAYLIVFSATFLILKIVTWILDAVFELPGLSWVNRLGGLAFGLCCGLLYAFVTAALIETVYPALSAMLPSYFPAGAQNTSYLLNLAAKYSIFSKFDLNFLGL